MSTRTIELDEPFDLTLEEKIVINAKRLCIVFAVAALALSGIDLLNAHALGNRVDHAYRIQVGSLARAIDRFSFTSASPSVTVIIPTGDVAVAVVPTTELAAARHQDAVKLAMLAPPPAADAVKLASIGPVALPKAAPVTPTIVLPAKISMLPQRPPPLSPARRLHLLGAGRVKAKGCLASAIYFKARDQPFRGQVAVAQVVINRVFSGIYPRDVCGVIYQNASHHLACQFTFACNGKRKVINERDAWARAVLDGTLYVRAVGTATHYHAFYVRPNWVREMHRIVREGSHTFYRPIAWGSGKDMPIDSRQELAANSRRR